MVDSLEILKRKNSIVTEVVNTSLMREYQSCLDDYKLALQQFNEASGDYIDISIMKLNLSKDKLDNVIKTMRVNQADMVK